MQLMQLFAKTLISFLYARFKGAKHSTLRGYRIQEAYGGIQRVIILFSLHRSQKASNLQLLQLLIISSIQLPTFQSLIYLIKYLSQATLILFVVQLLLLTLIRYQGFKSRYQDLLQVFTLKIKQNIITQPITLIIAIKVTYL